MQNFIKKIRVLLNGGIWVDDHALRCTVYDNSYAFGGLALAFGVFAAYILYFRPDIYKEVNPVIWIFRVMFPFGFGLAGLAMLGRSVRTVFDVKHGTFVCKKSSFFISVTRRGCIRDMTQLVLNAQCRGPEDASGSEQGRYYVYWYFNLSMDIDGELVPLRKWRSRIENRPQDETLDRAKAEAERLALFIDRPLKFA